MRDQAQAVPKARFGGTELQVSRIGLDGACLGWVDHAAEWDPWSEEGKAKAVRMIQAAMEAGINYIDTAPGYGQGQSETIVGEAVGGRRERMLVATRVDRRERTPEGVRRSVEGSLRRMRLDVIDVIQLQAVAYKEEDVRQILSGGVLDMLEMLRGQGKVRFIGFAVEEPWTARALIASFRFDVMQVRYNLLQQGAGLHALNDAETTDMGVVAMHATTRGMLRRICRQLAPGWAEMQDPEEVALKFVLSDSRVQVASVEACGEEEVAKWARVAASYRAGFDVAGMEEGEG